MIEESRKCVLNMKNKYKIEVLGEEVLVGFVGIVDLIIKPRLDTTTTLLPLYVGQVFHRFCFCDLLHKLRAFHDDKKLEWLSCCTLICSVCYPPHVHWCLAPCLWLSWQSKQVAHFVNSSSPSGQFKPATVKIQNVAMRLG